MHLLAWVGLLLAVSVLGAMWVVCHWSSHFLVSAVVVVGLVEETLKVSPVAMSGDFGLEELFLDILHEWVPVVVLYYVWLASFSVVGLCVGSLLSMRFVRVPLVGRVLAIWVSPSSRACFGCAKCGASLVLWCLVSSTVFILIVVTVATLLPFPPFLFFNGGGHSSIRASVRTGMLFSR